MARRIRLPTGASGTVVPPLEPHSDDTYLCQLCAHEETSECCQCHLFLCNKCMADHLCDLPDDEP